MNDDVREIALDRIDEPAHAMRADIDRDKVFELAESIKQHGLINPITVRPVVRCTTHNISAYSTADCGDNCTHQNRYEVVAGHRRLLAHRYGGIPTIKCVVRELNDEEAAAVMASENYDREDTNPIDDAHNVVHLLSLYSGDVGKVAKIVRRSAKWVEERVAIDAMPDYIKEPLKDGRMKIGVALALNDIEDDLDRQACVKMALTQGATVVVAQYWLAQWRAGLFGHAVGSTEPSSEGAPDARPVVKLRCRITDKDYPAEEMRSVLIHSSALGYIDALRETIRLESPETASSGGED